jgi:hypothetical protein
MRVLLAGLLVLLSNIGCFVVAEFASAAAYQAVPFFSAPIKVGANVLAAPLLAGFIARRVSRAGMLISTATGFIGMHLLTIMRVVIDDLSGAWLLGALPAIFMTISVTAVLCWTGAYLAPRYGGSM